MPLLDSFVWCASPAKSSSANIQAPGLVGVSVADGPGVSSWAPYGISLMVFIRNTDNTLWSKSYDQIDSVWGHWTPMYGSITSAPAATSLDAVHMYVYARGTTSSGGALYARWTGDGAQTWTWWYKPILGYLLAGTGPDVCSEDANTQELFVTGTNGNLYWSHWTTTTDYSPWKNLGGQLTGSPSATIMAGGIQLWGRGTTGYAYFDGYYSDIHGTWSWSGWRKIPDNT